MHGNVLQIRGDKMLENLLNKDLVVVNNTATTIVELFEDTANFLQSNGLVRSSYKEAIKKREAEFPTGLITENLNIGIPHSDPEHILEPFVCLVATDKPIGIKQMGDNQDMVAKNFFFLGIKDSKNQVGLLSEIMTYLREDEFNISLEKGEYDKLFEIINGD